MFLEPSCDATEEDKEPNMDEEEHGGYSAVPGETGEAKAKRKEEFGDIDKLLESSSDSMGELGGQKEPTNDGDESS